MKKAALAMLLLLAMGALALPAQEPAVQSATQMETAIRNAILLEPHYGVFDNLSFQLDGSNVTLLGQVLLPITKKEVAIRVAKLEGLGMVTNKIEVLPLSESDDVIRLRVYRSIFGSSNLYRYALGPNPSIEHHRQRQPRDAGRRGVQPKRTAASPPWPRAR